MACDGLRIFQKSSDWSVRATLTSESTVFHLHRYCATLPAQPMSVVSSETNEVQSSLYESSEDGFAIVHRLARI